MSIETYQTRDLPLAAFLVYNQMEMLGSATTSKPGSNMIVFIDRPDRPDLIKAFDNDVEVISYISIFKKDITFPMMAKSHLSTQLN